MVRVACLVTPALLMRSQKQKHLKRDYCSLKVETLSFWLHMLHFQ